MKWRIKKANKEYVCILCGKKIPVEEKYIRPYFQGLRKKVTPSQTTTWSERRPYFHVDCFKDLRGRWFGSTVPVYDLWGEEVQL